MYLKVSLLFIKVYSGSQQMQFSTYFVHLLFVALNRHYTAQINYYLLILFKCRCKIIYRQTLFIILSLYIFCPQYPSFFLLIFSHVTQFCLVTSSTQLIKPYVFDQLSPSRNTDHLNSSPPHHCSHYHQSFKIPSSTPLPHQLVVTVATFANLIRIH